MTQPGKILYTAKIHTTGGRGRASRSDDGRLECGRRRPARRAPAPIRQPFAAGWSACFEGAMGLAARRMKVALPADMAVDAEVILARPATLMCPSVSMSACRD